jgi:hypothetical protein
LKTAAAVMALVLMGGVASMALAAPADPASHDQHAAAAARKTSRQAFRAEMRKLWEDHITWTRLYIVSAATLEGDLPDIGPTADRLFANQADIGRAVGAFYGDEAGQALTDLLNEHISLAAQAIAAAKAGEQDELQARLDDWYANADDIARFLAKANHRSWPFKAMRTHMRDHLDLTLEEAVARLQGRYADDIAAYDAVHHQILEMADTLSNGIIDAFPHRFRR